MRAIPPCQVPTQTVLFSVGTSDIIKLDFKPCASLNLIKELSFGLNFTGEYEDTMSEIKSAARNRIYELANQYAIDFPYFTNNIDKLNDVLDKLKKKNFDQYNDFILNNNTSKSNMGWKPL